jgi:hypothetical protein
MFLAAIQADENTQLRRVAVSSLIDTATHALVIRVGQGYAHCFHNHRTRKSSVPPMTYSHPMNAVMAASRR